MKRRGVIQGPGAMMLSVRMPNDQKMLFLKCTDAKYDPDTKEWLFFDEHGRRMK
jgi:hypothetical protein